ncbi:hypothetical protein BDV23DRAFT_131168 [Aspergillus alliaceus]|uniref:Uncharacterized protein n=1 Tax=Petromyces alliaceus TaxID=209559 RepID=A0A5N7BZ81_PETAA|nr:hypothetical protein BDV23DRAFT_131168 [Aspergillus alliaceus]
MSILRSIVGEAPPRGVFNRLNQLYYCQATGPARSWAPAQSASYVVLMCGIATVIGYLDLPCGGRRFIGQDKERNHRVINSPRRLNRSHRKEKELIKERTEREIQGGRGRKVEGIKVKNCAQIHACKLTEQKEQRERGYRRDPERPR